MDALLLLQIVKAIAEIALMLFMARGFMVSLLTPAPDQKTQDLVEHVRYPNLTGDVSTEAT